MLRLQLSVGCLQLEQKKATWAAWAAVTEPTYVDTSMQVGPADRILLAMCLSLQTACVAYLEHLQLRSCKLQPGTVQLQPGTVQLQQRRKKKTVEIMDAFLISCTAVME